VNIARSRFGTSACPCGATVVEALLSLQRIPINVQPSPDGDLLLRDIPGMPAPVAVRQTVAQRFGRQGQLHTRHRCAPTKSLAAA